MGQHKRCKLIGHVINPATRPGTTFNIWGHSWIVQSNMDAIAFIDSDFHAAEVAAGRYVVLEDESDDTKAYELVDMGTEIGNYYGAGSLENFFQNIKRLRPEALRGFSKTRLNVTLPQSMNKKQILSEIMNLVAQKSSGLDIVAPIADAPGQDETPAIEKTKEEEKPKKKRGRPRTRNLKK